ncbi:MAG: cellulase family glycosylhydrolase [bacterium]|nr:cellulase family glycosylhydrolase [bacterium]
MIKQKNMDNKNEKKKIVIKTKMVVQQKLALSLLMVSSLILGSVFAINIFNMSFGEKALNKPKDTSKQVSLPTTITKANIDTGTCDHNGDGLYNLVDVGLFLGCKNTFDANNDGVHSLTDIGLYSANKNNTSWCTKFLPECTIAGGNTMIQQTCDHNNDGLYNLADAELFSACLGTFDANDDGVHDINDVVIYGANNQNQTWCNQWVPECAAVSAPTNELEFGLDVNMRTRAETDFSISVMNDLGINKTKIWENWILREPVSGEYIWAGLDMRVNSLSAADKDIIFIIKPVGIVNGSISWYCRVDLANQDSCVFKPEYEDDFAKYIQAIVQRYPGKIDKIEFSNEWDSNLHFIGTAQDYVKYANILYDTVKKYSPDTKVSLGSITKWPLIYVAACKLNLINEFYNDGQLVSDKQRTTWCRSNDVIAKNEKVAYVFANAKYDMVDVHFYDDPENWDEYMTALQSNFNVNNKPVIVTEFGGPNENDTRFDPYSEEFQATELQRYLDALTPLPILEAYYFRMISGEGEGINHPLTGLMKMEGINPVAKLNYDIFDNRAQ